MKRRLVTLVLMAVAWAGNAQLQNLDFETWDNPIVEETWHEPPHRVVVG